MGRNAGASNIASLEKKSFCPLAPIQKKDEGWKKEMGYETIHPLIICIITLVSESYPHLKYQDICGKHKDDTRAKSVHLTTGGKTIASKLVPIVEKIDEEFFGILSRTNQQSLINILADLVSKIEIAE